MIAELFVVLATCYHATPGQCNADYLTTADGTKIESTDTAYEQRLLAVSRDLRDVLPMGTKVILSGFTEEMYDGEWRVADLMGPGKTGMVDILINPGMPQMKEEIKLEIVK